MTVQRHLDRVQIIDLIERCRGALFHHFNVAKAKRAPSTQNLIEELRDLDESSKRDAAEFHLTTCRFVHTIELMRWYGQFRANKYNSESLLKLREKMIPWSKHDQEIREKIAQWYPAAESLRKSKMKELSKLKRSATKNLSAQVNDTIDLEAGDINSQLYGKIESHDFFILMLEPSSCLLRPR